MQRLTRHYPATMRLFVVMFIMFVGVLGYTYVLNYKAEVATAPGQSNTIAAQTTTVPTIENTEDLDAALATLDAASVDELSDADLQALEDDLNNL